MDDSALSPCSETVEMDDHSPVVEAKREVISNQWEDTVDSTSTILTDGVEDVKPDPVLLSRSAHTRGHNWLKMSDLPHDTDYDALLELVPVEDMRDDAGEVIKAWKCFACQLQFQFFESFKKHNQREHPGKGWRSQMRRYADSDYEYEDDGAFAIDSDDSDFDPKYRKRKRSHKKKQLDYEEKKPQKPKTGSGKRRETKGVWAYYDTDLEDDGVDEEDPGTDVDDYDPTLDQQANDYRKLRRKRLKVRTRSGKRPVVRYEEVKDVPTKCPDCDVELPSEQKMKSHQRRNHFFPFRCSVEGCAKKFDTFKKFYVHSEMMHDTIIEQDETYSPLSDAGESDAEEMRQPVEPIKSLLFPCDLCSNHYVSEMARTGHKLRRHIDEIPDMAQIETLKRMWKSRYEEEQIKKQEEALQQIGDQGKPEKKKTRVLSYDSTLLADELAKLLKNGEDPNLIRKGPAQTCLSKKPLAEIVEKFNERLLRRKKKLLEKKGIDTSTVTELCQRRPRKTLEEKLATHMAKLARRRERERSRRAQKRKNMGFTTKELKKPKGEGAEQQANAESNGEAAANGVPKRRGRKVLETYKEKYGGVKDTCRLCNQEFDDDREIILHLRAVHSSYSDELKQKELEIISEFIPEEDNSRPIKRAHPCFEQGCTKSFMALFRLAAHTEKDHQKKLIVNGEEVSSEMPEEYKRTNEQSIICAQCGASIKKRSIRVHMLRNHVDTKFKLAYPCDQCDKSYESGNKLFWHRRKNHTKVALFTCEVCGKEIRSPRQHKFHKRMHSGLMYICKTCGVEFKSPQGLVNHEKRHTGIMEHECEFCGKRFWWDRDRRKHIAKQHEDGVVNDVQLRENRLKDWVGIAEENAKKKRVSRTDGEPSRRRKSRKTTLEDTDESQSQDIMQQMLQIPEPEIPRPAVPRKSSRQSAAARAAAAACAGDAVAIQPKRSSRRKTKAQKQKEEEEARAIESLDLTGLEPEPIEYSVVTDMPNQQYTTHQVSGQYAAAHHLGLAPSQIHSVQQGYSSNNSYHVLQQQTSHHQHNAVDATKHMSLTQMNQLFINSCMQQQQYQVPLIPGDCKLCRTRTNDLRAHYSEVHKVLPDVVQHFL